jgi:DNA polymerase III gamma/tau subunit
MDKNQAASVTYTPATLPPALLFTSNTNETLAATEQLLQSLLCRNNICNTCTTCLQIREKQHHAIMWLHPEKNYTIDQFDDVFATLSLQLQPDEFFFFVIQKADFLPAACANKLLKPMEEPPTGYHFILLAEHPEQIVPTIKSRCVIHALNNSTLSAISHPLFEVFTQKIIPSNDFAKLLDSVNINERESMELFDQILNYWLTEYHKEVDSRFRISDTKSPMECDENGVKIAQLQKVQLQPPMPGSSVIFWRNLYLQMRGDLQ